MSDYARLLEENAALKAEIARLKGPIPNHGDGYGSTTFNIPDVKPDEPAIAPAQAWPIAGLRTGPAPSIEGMDLE